MEIDKNKSRKHLRFGYNKEKKYIYLSQIQIEILSCIWCAMVVIGMTDTRT